MSLPHLLRKGPVKFAFRERVNFNFNFPEIENSNTDLFVQEKNTNQGESGGAFDYLLRFYIQHLNQDKNITNTEWTAKSAIEQLHWEIYECKTKYKRKYFWRGEIQTPKKFYKNILQEFYFAFSNYKKFITDGKITTEILKSCLFLARLDVYIRNAFNLVENFGIYKEEEIKELESLFKIIPQEKFKVKENLILNPYFPGFSADGDIVIDDTLIEIKTIDKIELKADFKYQLVLYYVLHLINGVNGNKKYKIENLGIYYSRFGILFTFPIKKIGSKKAFESFKNWYLSTLKPSYEHFKEKMTGEDKYQKMINNKIESLLTALGVTIPETDRPFDPINIYLGHGYIEHYFKNSKDYEKFKKEVFKKM